jgi:hypothetical protein
MYCLPFLLRRPLLPLKDLLKKKELAFPSAQNELVFERQEGPSKRKILPQTGDL